MSYSSDTCFYPARSVSSPLYTRIQFHFSFSVALQPFVGPWPLHQFRDLLYTDGRTPWTGDQAVARPLPTHRAIQKEKNTHTNICALSGIRTHNPNVRASKDISCLRALSHCDRHKHFPYYNYSKNISDICTSLIRLCK
jgi:hypothetical protein